MSSYQQPLILIVLAGVLALLIFASIGADAVLLSGLLVCVLLGLIDVKTALSGFANEGMLTVAALFIVAAGVRQTGAMSKLSGSLLGQGGNMRVALTRLTLPVAVLSSVLNNTPIVAAMVPSVAEWARRHQLPPSKLLMPLSFATILGGTVTLIGTSTNLLVSGLIERQLNDVPGLQRLGVFSLAPVGIPVAIIGCVVLIGIAPLVLPDRRPPISASDDPRLYTSEFIVNSSGALVGKSIEAAGLRHLPGAYVAELHRGVTLLPAVEPSTLLAAEDRLVLVGPREAVVDLQRIEGLTAAPSSTFGAFLKSGDRSLVEAVVAPGNPLCGQTIRDGDFRAQFQAVVVAAARDGQRIQGRIGDIKLERGDILLLDCAPAWASNQRNRKDFYLVSEVADSSRFRYERMLISVGILSFMVLAAATELTSMFVASAAGAAAMILTGCVTGAEARRSIELPVLVTIAAAFGLGECIRVSGLDRVLAEAVVGWGSGSPMTALCGLYLVTMVLTELVTNNAAAALMFPFGLSLAARLGVSPMPFCVAVMFAASASFSTPIGYQTNLMVFGPGGYRFGDFFKLGIPIQLSVAVATCALIPLVFPF